MSCVLNACMDQLGGLRLSFARGAFKADRILVRAKSKIHLAGEAGKSHWACHPLRNRFPAVVDSEVGVLKVQSSSFLRRFLPPSFVLVYIPLIVRVIVTAFSNCFSISSKSSLNQSQKDTCYMIPLT